MNLPTFFAAIVATTFVLAVVITRGDPKALIDIVRRLAPPFAVMGIIVSALWLTRTPPPPLRSVDGVYKSSCCAPVELKNGVLATTALRVPFQLEIDKWGKLNAVPLVTLEVRDGKVGPVGGEATRFIFTDDRKAFTLCDHICATEYQFVRR